MTISPNWVVLRLDLENTSLNALKPCGTAFTRLWDNRAGAHKDRRTMTMPGDDHAGRRTRARHLKLTPRLLDMVHYVMLRIDKTK